MITLSNKRTSRAMLLCMALSLVLSGLPWGPVVAQGGSRTFPETGKSVKGRFLEYWNTRGGLLQQGYPISEEMLEVSETDGKTYTVQYFERAVFELHPENPAPNDVLLSLLGNFLYQEKYPDGALNQQPNTSAGSVVFNETGKRLGGIFLDYWRKNGGLAQQGLPISDEFMEVSDLDGKTYRVQYFERAVFEYHPEEKPEYRVLLSHLGTFRYRTLYQVGEIRYPTGAGQLTIWHSYSGLALATLKRAVQDITLKNKDFKVTLESIPLDQLQPRFISAVAAGTAPDLVLGPSEWTGALAEAKSILPAEAIEAVNTLIAELQPTAVNVSKYGGKLYGIPVNMKTVALVYNKTAVKTLPASVDDLLAQARSLVGADNGAGGKVQYGLAVVADFLHTIGYNFGFGGKLFTSNNPDSTNKQVDLTTQGTLDWLGYLKRLKETAGVLARTRTNPGPAWKGGAAPAMDLGDDVAKVFRSGLAAMTLSLPEKVRQFERSLGKINLGVTLPPPTTKGGKYTPFVSTDNYFVSAGASTAAKMKAVSEFLKYITSPGVQQGFVNRVGQLAANIKVNLSASPALMMIAQQIGQTSEETAAYTAAYAAAYNSLSQPAGSNLAVFLDQSNQGTPSPNIKGAEVIFSAGDAMIADVIEGRASAQDAARRATDIINKAIARPQAGGSMFRGNPQHTAHYETAGVSQMSAVKWQFKAEGSVRASPAFADGVIYFGSHDRHLYAVDMASGQLRWRVGTSNWVESSPAVANGLVYFGSYDHNLYALDVKTAAIRWAFKTNGIVSSSPVVADGMVYFGSQDGHIYARDAITGAERWRVKTGDSVTSSPAVADGTVFVGSEDEHMYALDARTGAQKWKLKIGDGIFSSPAVANGVVYFGGEDLHLYAVSAATGQYKWTFKTNGQIFSSPAVADGMVYFGSNDNHLYAVDASTGQQKWKFQTGNWVYSSPAVADGMVYFGSEDNNLYALDARTGAQKWKFQAKNWVDTSPAVDNGVVYFGSDDGNFYAVR